MKTEAKFTFDKVRFDQENKLHMVLGLTAPVLSWQTQRPPLRVVPVVDVSGSMSGQKLAYAKKSVLALVDHLQPQDSCGLVIFGDDAKMVYPVQQMTGAAKEELKAKVGAIEISGSTNFSAGLMMGLDMLQKEDAPAEAILRVIMFTDGMANRGISNRPGILTLTGEPNRKKVTVSAFGYGTDADQDLLADVAKTGEGNYAFIRNPDDALSAFAKELGGLLSTYAQNTKVVLTPVNGHRVSEVVSDVDVTQDKERVEIKVPDIFSEETRNLVLAIQLSKQSQAFPRQSTVFEVKVEYDALIAGKREHQVEELKAKVQFVKEGEEQKTATKVVDEIVARAQLIKAQVESEAAAKRGDFDFVQAQCRRVVADFGGRGHEALRGMAAGMGARMRNAQAYTANQGYLSSFKAGMSSGVRASGLDAEAAMDLESMGVVLNNAAQEELTASFLSHSNSQTPEPAQTVSSLPVPPSFVDVMNVVVVPAEPTVPDVSKKKSNHTW